MAGAPLLDEKILGIQQALDAEGVPHAFGGALALAYYATPRGTIDIDVNVFVEIEQANAVLELLASIGLSRPSAADRRRLTDSGQIRLFWAHTPVDLFFAYDPLHDACLRRRRSVPFGGDELRILSAEDLAVFKALFDRDKDRRDLEELLFAQGESFDAAYALDWLSRILEPDDARLARFRELLARDAR